MLVSCKGLRGNDSGASPLQVSCQMGLTPLTSFKTSRSASCCSNLAALIVSLCAQGSVRSIAGRRIGHLPIRSQLVKNHLLCKPRRLSSAAMGLGWQSCPSSLRQGQGRLICSAPARSYSPPRPRGCVLLDWVVGSVQGRGSGQSSSVAEVRPSRTKGSKAWHSIDVVVGCRRCQSRTPWCSIL